MTVGKIIRCTVLVLCVLNSVWVGIIIKVSDSVKVTKVAKFGESVEVTEVYQSDHDTVQFHFYIFSQCIIEAIHYENRSWLHSVSSEWVW